MHGQKLKTTWLPQGLRPHQHPRGIQIGLHNDRSLQNVVYQSLMHLPIFVRWVKSHNENCTAAVCTLCTLKDLVREYWGPHNANVPFHHTHMALATISNTAAAHNALADAYNFYEWITARLNMGDPRNMLLNDPRNPWDNELRALFQLDVSQRADCSTCFNSVWTREEFGIIDAEYNMYTHDDLDDIVSDWFTEDHGLRPCPTCGTVQDFSFVRDIEAAPQVLRIKVHLYATIAGLATKQSVPFDVPDTLRLTEYQENMRLPLEYTLSSAIAHGGSGGAEEVFDLVTPNMSDDDVALSSHGDEDEDEDEDEEENGGNEEAPMDQDFDDDPPFLQAHLHHIFNPDIQHEAEIGGNEEFPMDQDVEDNPPFLQIDLHHFFLGGHAPQEEPWSPPLPAQQEEPWSPPLPAQQEEPWSPVLHPDAHHPYNEILDDDNWMLEPDDAEMEGEELVYSGPIDDDVEEEEEDAYRGEPREWLRPGAPRRSETPPRRPNSSPPRYTMTHFNGLVEVTREEFINELGPGSSQPTSDVDEDEFYGYQDQLFRRDSGVSLSTISVDPIPQRHDSGISLPSENDSETISAMPSDVGGAPRTAPGPPATGVPQGFGPVQDFINAWHGNNNAAPPPANPNNNPLQNLVDLTQDNDDPPDDMGSDSSSSSEEHWIVNTQGPGHVSHISDEHYRTLVPGHLNDNPQAPQLPDPCWRPDDYQVYILTYTRNKLRGRDGKRERDIPPFV